MYVRVCISVYSHMHSVYLLKCIYVYVYMYMRLPPSLCLSLPLFLYEVLYCGEIQRRNVLCHACRAQNTCIFVCVCVCV